MSSAEQLTPKSKRKSEGIENVAPNLLSVALGEPQSAKKSKLAKPQVVSKVRSGLPRFNQVKSSSVLAEPAKKAAAPAASAVNAEQPTRVVVASSTPAKKVFTVSKSSTPGVLSPFARKNVVVSEPIDVSSISRSSAETVKRLQKCVANLQGSDRIRIAFETGFSVTEESISEAIKIRLGKEAKASKWDYKDKATKQAALITDLRTLFKTIFDEKKNLQSICVPIESSMSVSMKEVAAEVEDFVQIFSSMSVNDSRLRKEISRLSEELATTSSNLKTIQAESAPLKTSIKELENKHWKVIEKLASEEAARNHLESENQRLRQEYETSKAESSSVTSTMKSQYEQRIEESIAGYKDEVASLRNELSKR